MPYLRQRVIPTAIAVYIYRLSLSPVGFGQIKRVRVCVIGTERYPCTGIAVYVYLSRVTREIEPSGQVKRVLELLSLLICGRTFIPTATAVYIITYHPSDCQFCGALSCYLWLRFEFDSFFWALLQMLTAYMQHLVFIYFGKFSILIFALITVESSSIYNQTAAFD